MITRPGHIIDRATALPRRIWIEKNELRAEHNGKVYRLPNPNANGHAYTPDHVLDRIHKAGGRINLNQWALCQTSSSNPQTAPGG